MEENAPFVVLKLEEDACDEGHSTLTVHGESEVVAGLSAAVALMIVALADETGGELFERFDPPELGGDEPEGDLAESA